MTCFFCKNTKCVESFTSHVVCFDGNIIVIKNVPCLKCTQCGEEYYTNEVTKRIEAIVQRSKQLAQQLAIIEYTAA